jgi:HK97 family phage major capsid protein
MTPVEEMKDLLNQQTKTWNDFKAENDKRLKEIEKNGAANATTVQNVEKLNSTIDELQSKFNDAQRRASELEAAVNRINLSGGASNIAADAETFNRNLKVFNRLTGRDNEADDYRNYRKAVDAYLRSGDKAISNEMRNALSVGAESSGGYWVLPDTSGQMVTKVYETSPMRALASVTTISSDALEGPVDNDQATSGGWVTEKTAPSNTATAKVGKWRIEVHTQYAMPKVTQQLLDDVAFPVESWLQQKTNDILDRTETTAFFTGNGSGKPRGFLDYTIVTTADSSRAWDNLQYVASGAAGDWAASNPADKIIDLIYTLKNYYRTGASFVAARVTYAGIRKFKDTTGQYLWAPGLTAGQPATLLNFPAIEAEDMPQIAANSYSLAFGNFKMGYQIVDRAGISTLRDPYTAKPYVLFYSTKRVGGGLINGEAIKVMKFAAS